MGLEQEASLDGKTLLDGFAGSCGAAVLSGQSCRQAAGVFGVGISTVIRWVQLSRLKGDVAPRAMGGDRRSKLMGERDWLLSRIAACPDLTLEELRGELAARKVIVGYGAVWRFFAAEGISFKKNSARRRAGSRGRGDCQGRVEKGPALP